MILKKENLILVKFIPLRVDLSWKEILSLLFPSDSFFFENDGTDPIALKMANALNGGLAILSAKELNCKFLNSP